VLMVLAAAGLTAAWAAIHHHPWFLPGLAAMGAVAYLWAGAPATVGRGLVLGLLGLLLLGLRDWLPPLPQAVQALPGMGELSPPVWPGRNVQAWPAWQQAGAVATLILGGGGLRALLARGWLRREQGLAALTLVLLAWTLWAGAKVSGGQGYGELNRVGAVASKNAAATLVALGLILSWGWMQRAWRREPGWARWLTPVGVALGAGVLAALQSLTGVLGAAVGIGCLMVGRRTSHRVGRWGWAVVTVLGLIVAVGALNPTLVRRWGQWAEDYRWQIWRDLLSLGREYPLGGAGLGAFEGLYPLYGRVMLPANVRLSHPDSSWILLGVEWGVVATVLLVALGAWWWLGRAQPESPGGGAGAAPSIGALARAAVLGWAVMGLTDITLHRPETLLPGVMLLAFLPGRSGIQAGRGWRWAGGGAGLALGAVALTGSWAAISHERARTWEHFQPAALRWAPLDSQLHYLAALHAWNEAGDTGRALRHFDRAVTLRHRSMILPETVARLLTRPMPAEAAPFWVTAMARGRQAPGMSTRLLHGAWREFPEVPLAYWEAVVREGNPGLLVLLAARPEADQDRLLAEWFERAGACYVLGEGYTPAFFQAVRAAPDGVRHLRTVLDELAPLVPREFAREAALVYRERGHWQEAWDLLVTLRPWAEAQLDLSWQLDPAYAVWWQLLTTPEHVAPAAPGRLRLLERICAQPGMPLWFHLELARAHFHQGRLQTAVDYLLDWGRPRPARAHNHY
jgi:hypothetical protein